MAFPSACRPFVLTVLLAIFFSALAGADNKNEALAHELDSIPGSGFRILSENVRAPDDLDSLRVMSYNIKCDSLQDENSWENRRKAMVQLIERHHPDIMGNQEVLKNQLDDLHHSLPEYGYIGVGRDDGQSAGEFAPLFYRKSRLYLLDSGTFWVSQNPDKPGSRGWDAACPRLVTWGKFKLRSAVNGADQAAQLLQLGNEEGVFYAFNTHFDHIGKQARRKGGELVLKTMREIAGDYPAWISGDMNFHREDPGYRVITAQHSPIVSRYVENLQDALLVSKKPPSGPVLTFNRDFKEPLEERIDYIFVDERVSVEEFTTITDKMKNGHFPSDHLPIMAILALKPSTDDYERISEVATNLRGKLN